MAAVRIGMCVEPGMSSDHPIFVAHGRDGNHVPTHGRPYLGLAILPARAVRASLAPLRRRSDGCWR